METLVYIYKQQKIRQRYLADESSPVCLFVPSTDMNHYEFFRWCALVTAHASQQTQLQGSWNLVAPATILVFVSRRSRARTLSFQETTLCGEAYLSLPFARSSPVVRGSHRGTFARFQPWWASLSWSPRGYSESELRVRTDARGEPGCSSRGWQPTSVLFRPIAGLVGSGPHSSTWGASGIFRFATTVRGSVCERRSPRTVPGRSSPKLVHRVCERFSTVHPRAATASQGRFRAACRPATHPTVAGHWDRPSPLLLRGGLFVLEALVLVYPILRYGEIVPCRLGELESLPPTPRCSLVGRRSASLLGTLGVRPCCRSCTQLAGRAVTIGWPELEWRRKPCWPLPRGLLTTWATRPCQLPSGSRRRSPSWIVSSICQDFPSSSAGSARLSSLIHFPGAVDRQLSLRNGVVQVVIPANPFSFIRKACLLYQSP